jgi:hypothetical protein
VFSVTAPTITLGSYVLDCPDPVALGRFYARVLGVADPEVEPDARWVDVAAGAVTLSFQRVDGHLPPSWPDGAPQQAHLDFEVAQFGPAHEHVVGLGAVPLDPAGPVGTEGGRGFRVYADPAGHPFCLCLS